MSKAQKLLERMRQTKNGYGQSDFQCLYLGFGFEEKQGGSHAKFVYEKYKLIAVVARHNVLATGYAVDAVKLIDKLISEQAKEEDNGDTA